MINDNIGDYRIVRSLGKGGFGSVWEAEAKDGTVVAMKILNPQVLQNEKVVRKFFHEAMILAKLDHPNICRLLDFFPDGDNYAIVMEYVQGVELKQLLSQHKGPLPFEQAYAIAKQTLDAFQYAHQNGILHRDIKPGNIMIDHSGNAKIMDFGIASMSTIASQDTAASMLSVNYVPPERFDKSREIDTRSDIYSLGLVFYEMFAGRRAFDATDTSQVMFCHLNEIPEPPKKFVDSLPQAISSAISKALEKNPDDRFNDFREFSLALKIDQQAYDDATAIYDDATLVTAAAPAEEPASRVAAGAKEAPRKSAAPLIGILIALLLIGGGVGGYVMLKRQAPAPKTATATPVAEQAGSQNAAKVYSEVEHPQDGSVMVLVPAGEFIMGSEKYSAEEPVQTIYLDNYYIDKYPVTNRQFQKFVTAAGYVTDAETKGYGMVRIGRRWKKVDGASWRKPDGLTTIEDKADHPVAQVSYNDAVSYCRWAQKDLPTEAQWEKGARGPSGNEYPWGNTEPNDTVANFDNVVGSTTPVGSYEKGRSYYGLYDMAGNVYQWTRDWYATGPRPAKNPLGPESGEEHVIKGGSFIEGVESIRSANRDRYAPDYSSFLFGFRCAKPYK
jgi:serine/threonine-protein kinase